jgi:hypothetical protein
MTAPDDATLRAWIAAADPSRPWPGRDAENDARLEELACAAPALAAEVLRLRAILAAAVPPTPARLSGCETVGPCGYCDHPERPR